MSDHTMLANRSRSNGPLPVSVAVAQVAQSEAVADSAIATRAYQKFVARGSAHGYDQEDWAAAKRELVVEALGLPR